MAFPKHDIHAHFVPDFYRESFSKLQNADTRLREFPQWSPQAHLDFMKAATIKKSYLSICPPGTSAVGVQAATTKLSIELTRQVNDYGSLLKREYPSRFGYFACLPQSDKSESVKEIERCHKELGNIDGYIIFASATQSESLTRDFSKVKAALNELDAVVFLHSIQDCAIIETFSGSETSVSRHGFFESAAQISSRHLLLDFVTRYPRIRCILPHACDVLPRMISNVLVSSHDGGTAPQTEVPEIALHDAEDGDDSSHDLRENQLLTPHRLKEIFASSVWLDLAGNPSAEALREVLQWTDHSRLLFGSNVPLMPFAWAMQMEVIISEMISSTFGGETGANEALRICYGNAETLFGG